MPDPACIICEDPVTPDNGFHDVRGDFYCHLGECEGRETLADDNASMRDRLDAAFNFCVPIRVQIQLGWFTGYVMDIRRPRIVFGINKPGDPEVTITFTVDQVKNLKVIEPAQESEPEREETDDAA